MNILLISHFFPPYHTAGTEKRTLGYALQLLRMGHTVQVLCTERWDKGKKYWDGFSDELYLGMPIRRIHINWMLAPDPNKYLYDNPVVERYLDEWLEQWQPDIVHITSCVTLSGSVIRAAKKRGIPVVLTLTDFWFICPKINLVRGDGLLCDGDTTSWECLRCLMWDTKIYRDLCLILPDGLVERILTKVTQCPSISRLRGFRGMALDMDDRKTFLSKMIHSVDCITAPSKFLSQIFEDSGVSKPIRVIYSGHDLDWLKTMPPKTSGDFVKYGYIGQIVPTKGIHILIESFLSILVSGQEKLLIFGDQNHDPEYSAYLKTLYADKKGAIEFRGVFLPEYLGEVLSQIDVLIVPSQWHENNPRVIQEAFASKTPVIASNVGGISEFVTHGVNGLLFKRDSVTDLANQLLLIESDQTIINRLRDGIRPIKTIDEEISEFISIYKELIAR